MNISWLLAFSTCLAISVLASTAAREGAAQVNDAFSSHWTDDEVRSSARQMHSIMLALHEWHNEAGHFPPGSNRSEAAPEDQTKSDEAANLSWRVMILPQIGENRLYSLFRLDEAWDSPHNKALLEQMPAIFKAPGSSAKVGHTNYLGVCGNHCAFHPSQPVAVEEITDGTVQTLMLAELADAHAVPWTKPDDFFVPDAEAGPAEITVAGLRDGAFLACTADGTPRVILNEIPQESLRALLTRNEGVLVNVRNNPWIMEVPGK